MACDLTIGGKEYSREYNDYAGCGGPEAEKVFREAFLAAAEEVADWDFPDIDSIKAAWQERTEARQRAEKWVTEKEYFGASRSDGLGMMWPVYQCGHEIEAARTRAKVHAFIFAVKAWQHFVALGLTNNEIHREFMHHWHKTVRTWMELPIDAIERPPRPDEKFAPSQWGLLLAKQCGEKAIFVSLVALESYLNNYYRRVLDAWPCFDTSGKRLGHMFSCHAPWNATVIRLAVCDNERWILRGPARR